MQARSSASASSVIEQIAAWVREGYPLARALILTGSAARGEATFLRTAEGTRWLSDLEFLAVAPQDRDFAAESARLDQLAAEMERGLTDRGVFVDIDLAAAPEGNFARLKPNLFTLELRTHGKQLFGEREYLRDIPAFSWEQIPKEDAWRLLSNRMVEWLDSQLNREEQPVERRFYALTKQYLDLVTSASLVCGLYSSEYRTRLERLDEISARLATHLPAGVVEKCARGARVAMEFKLGPEAPQFDWMRDAADLRSGLASAGWEWMYDDLFALHGAFWEWELRAMAGAEVRDALEAMAGVYGWRYRLRGWGKLALRPELRRGGRFFGRLPRLFAAGAPRALVYFCARTLLDPVEGRSEAALEQVRRRLPVMFEGGSGTWEELAGQCARNWRQYLKRSYA